MKKKTTFNIEDYPVDFINVSQMMSYGASLDQQRSPSTDSEAEVDLNQKKDELKQWLKGGLKL